MRAAVLRQHNVPLEIENVDVVEPKQNEVMVRIAASGICGSGIHVFRGKANVANCLIGSLGEYAVVRRRKLIKFE